MTVPSTAKRSSAWASGSTLPVALTVASIAPVLAVTVCQPGVVAAVVAVAPIRCSASAPAPISTSNTVPPINSGLRPNRTRLRGVAIVAIWSCSSGLADTLKCELLRFVPCVLAGSSPRATSGERTPPGTSDLLIS